MTLQPRAASTAGRVGRIPVAEARNQRRRTTMFDTLIRGARIIDGTGSAGYIGDIGIEGDRITAMGAIPEAAEAGRTLQAQGLAAAPGFIDIHTHADIALMARPEHLPKVMQGVTTEIFTNCGLGFAPVTEEGLAIQRRYIAG